MNKKLIAFGIVSIFLMMGLTTVSASSGTGDIGAVVAYKKIIIKDATVYCKDISGDTHDMPYTEYEPGCHAYVAYDVPEGKCEITVSKEGFKTTTIDAEVIAGGFREYLIVIEKKSKSVHPAFLRLLDLLPNAFPLLRLLLKL